MTLAINGKQITIDSSLSVSELLEHQDVESPDMVSVQLNGEILEREDFDSTTVSEGDEVEFLYFMGGGAR